MCCKFQMGCDIKSIISTYGLYRPFVSVLHICVNALYYYVLFTYYAPYICTSKIITDRIFGDHCSFINLVLLLLPNHR